MQLTWTVSSVMMALITSERNPRYSCHSPCSSMDCVLRHDGPDHLGFCQTGNAAAIAKLPTGSNGLQVKTWTYCSLRMTTLHLSNSDGTLHSTQTL